MKEILEIGCGSRPYRPKKGEKAIHLDIRKLPDVEVVHDLNNIPYPFRDNRFDVIIANHVIEHLDNVPRVMEELHRILKPKGAIKIRAPFFKWNRAFTITHKHFFTLESFNDIRGFKIVKKELWFPKPYKFRMSALNFSESCILLYENWISTLFPAEEIYYELVKK